MRCIDMKMGQRSLCGGVLSGARCRMLLRSFLGGCTGVYLLSKQVISFFIDLPLTCSPLKVTVFFDSCVCHLLLAMPRARSGTGRPCWELSCLSGFRGGSAVLYLQGFLLYVLIHFLVAVYITF